MSDESLRIRLEAYVKAHPDNWECCAHGEGQQCCVDTDIKQMLEEE